MWRLLARRLLASCLLATGVAQAAPVDRFPRAASGYIAELNGQTRWARAADVPRPPASLAKLMTAILVIDSGEPPEQTLRVSANAARVEGSRIGLRAGDTLTRDDALAAMLVASANDACMALAEHHAGSAAAFVDRMNDAAARLGMTRTHFKHPCGLDIAGQATTPADLLILAHAALQRPRLLAHVQRTHGTLVTHRGRRLAYRTSNALLGRVEGARGLKTGYTQRAGKCLIAWVRRPSGDAIVVLMDAPDRWWTAAILIEELFSAAAP